MSVLHRIIRRRNLDEYCGLKHTQVDRLISVGEFPAPIKLSDTGRAVGWLESDLLAWQERRIAATRAGKPEERGEGG